VQTASDYCINNKHSKLQHSEPPASDDESILPSGEMEPVVSGTVGTLKSIEYAMGTLLADEERSSE
jgi:hypothetical protein